MSKTTRARVKRRVWLCRDGVAEPGYPYSVYAGPRRDLTEGSMVWISPSPKKWLTVDGGGICQAASNIRHEFHYHGPLPAPGKCLYVTVEVPA